MRRFTTVLLAGLMLVGIIAGPASAQGTDTATAELQVIVPEAITITFSDGSEDFGTLAPGARSEVLDALAYDVSTNVDAGFSIDLVKGSNSSFSGFELSQDDFATSVSVPASQIGNTFAADWRVETDAGDFSYTDDAAAEVPLGNPSNTYLAEIDYVATTN
jgi:hypothetical protein